MQIKWDNLSIQKLLLVIFIFGSSAHAVNPCLVDLALLTFLSSGDYIQKVRRHNKKSYTLQETLEALADDEQAQALLKKKKKFYKKLKIQKYSIKNLTFHFGKKLNVFIQSPLNFVGQPWFNFFCLKLIYDTWSWSRAVEKQLLPDDFNLFTQEQKTEYHDQVRLLKDQPKADERIKLLASLPPFVFGASDAQTQKENMETVKKDFESLYSSEALKKEKWYRVKEQIYQFLYAAAERRLQNKSTAGICICLQGSPGVGKSEIAQEIAEELFYSFYRYPMGDESSDSATAAELKGFQPTFQHAGPGVLVEALQQVVREKKDGLIFSLDECDKSKQLNTIAGIIDPIQNQSFRDHFLDTSLDLSSVIFIATSNQFDDLAKHSPSLADRMMKIEISDYTVEEKIRLIEKIIADPKQKKYTSQFVHFFQKYENKECIRTLIEKYDATPGGVRKLFQMFALIESKILWNLLITQDQIMQELDAFYQL